MGFLDDLVQKSMVGQQPDQASPLLAMNGAGTVNSPVPIPPSIRSVDPNAMAPLPQSAPPAARTPTAAKPNAPTPEDDESNASDDEQKTSINDLWVTKGDLENAADAKRRDLGLGMMLEGLGNRQSFGNFFTGRMNPHNDFMGYAKQMASLEDQPIEIKKAMTQQLLNKPIFENQIKMADPASPISQVYANAAVAYARENGMNPDLFKGKSALEIQTAAPGIVEALGKEHAVIRAHQMMADLYGKRLGVQQDNQANKAADQFDNDPVIKPLVERRNQIALDLHTLQNSQVVTPQMMDEMAQGLANALAGGKGAGFHQTDMNRIKDAQKWLADNRQKIEGKPYNALSSDFRQYLDDTFDRLDTGYANAISARAQQKRQGRNYQFNPAANAAMDAKVREYTAVPSPKSAATSQMDPKDVEALQYVKDHPGDEHNAAILMKLRKRYPGQVQ